MKIPIISVDGQGCRTTVRLRSHPSNLSGSYQRREPRLTDQASRSTTGHLGKTPCVIVIGAGVIGLGIAWRLAGRARVTVFDRGPAGAGASHAAAGMLAACCEAEPGEEDLVALGRDSQARWPGFAEELGRASGIDVELRREGTLVLALTADDQAEIGHRLEFQQQKLDLPLHWLSAAETRTREPHLAGKIAGAVFSPEDHQVDNRRLAQALRTAAERAGVTIHEHRPVKETWLRGGRAAGVVLDDGTAVPADIVVLAAGAWSRRIGGLPPDRRPPVRPVKGQMLALQMDAAAPLLDHVLWAPGVYMVPRRDGRLIVGGTVEEKGFDETITAGGLLTLLEAAWRAVPAIEELPVAEIWVGHRPGSRDDAPILGRGPADGLFYATGHHRNGILLTPVTADAMAHLILDDVVEPAIRPFGLERFLPARAAE